MDTQTTEVVQLQDQPNGIVSARLEAASFELASQIGEQLLTCLKEAACNVLIVRLGTDQVDSTFLGMLVTLHHRAVEYNKKVIVECVRGSHFQEVLGITNLDKVLEVCVVEPESK